MFQRRLCFVFHLLAAAVFRVPASGGELRFVFQLWQGAVLRVTAGREALTRLLPALPSLGLRCPLIRPQHS